MGPRVSDRATANESSIYEEVTHLRQRVKELEKQAEGREQVEASLRESRDLFQCFMNNSLCSPI